MHASSHKGLMRLAIRLNQGRLGIKTSVVRGKENVTLKTISISFMSALAQ